MKRLLSLLCFISVLIVIGGVSAQTAERPLIMPVEGAPGPGTWLFGQPYGNTVGAYNFGTAWYSAGEGLHFGIDLSMPCGTRLVAAADGEVLFVDNLSFGSAPHNLLIRHDGAGVVALYGHLLQRSDLQPGQRVTQGQFVGLSGDPDLTCDSRPHLHYELRSLNYGTTYNPVSYIDAAWDSLAIIGGFSYPFFALDLNNARRWLSLVDQPDVVFGGRRLNDYANVYPALGNRRPLPSATLVRNLPAPEGSWSLRTLAQPDCCWLHMWHPTDPNRLYVLDGAANQRATISVWDAAGGQPVADAGTDMPYFSPDGNYEIYQVGSYISLRDTRDGSVRPLFTGGVIPSISPDSQHLLWITRSGSNVPGQATSGATIWMSDLNGENGQVVLSDVGLGAQWLDSDRLLISQPTPEDSRRLSILTLSDGGSVDLGTWSNMRGTSVAPGGGHLVFYLSFQSNPAANGMYVIETLPGASAQKLDWFGGSRWRDAHSLYYIPFTPETDVQSLHYYDLNSGEDRALTDPVALPFSIMNGDWAVSADGRRIVFQDARTRSMSLLELTP